VSFTYYELIFSQNFNLELIQTSNDLHYGKSMLLLNLDQSYHED
jgi:hypothetical protein